MDIIQSGIMVAGILSLALAIFHVPGIWQYVFPAWKEELEKTSLLNRKLVNTILIALALLFLKEYMGGPFADRSGGLITFETKDIEEATRIIIGDPFVAENLVENKWIKEWVMETGDSA